MGRIIVLTHVHAPVRRKLGAIHQNLRARRIVEVDGGMQGTVKNRYLLFDPDNTVAPGQNCI